MSDSSPAAGCLSHLPEKQPGFRKDQHNCAARESQASADTTSCFSRRSWRLSLSKSSPESTAAFGNERRWIEQTFDYVALSRPPGASQRRSA